jgi:hypothetical protein
MHTSARIFASVSLAFTAASMIGAANAESLDAHVKALDSITKAVAEICTTISTAGNVQSLKVKGDVKAQLDGLIRHLANIGISGVADYSADEYQNVIQADLAATLKNNVECRLKVFDKLQEKMIK